MKAANDRKAGWSRVREYLQPMPVELDGQATERPALRIFANCTNLIRTFPLQMHKDTDPEDTDTTLEDHAVDCVRYLAMHRPREARKKEIPKTGLEARMERNLKRLEQRESHHHPDLGRV